MKKFLTGRFNILSFDFVLQYEYIEQSFLKIHQKEEQRYLRWSTTASVKKVIFHYWYHEVLKHFITLLGTASMFCLSVAELKNNFDSFHLIAYPVFGCIIFFILLFIYYAPFFYNDFLPKLQSIALEYNGKQSAQLEKCKQVQYSNLALILIFYSWNKTSDLNALHSSEGLSITLMKLYGIDNGSIKKNLELLINKHSTFTSRKLKEIEKGFEEAFSFFQALEYQKGISVLKAFEMKIKNQ